MKNGKILLGIGFLSIGMLSPNLTRSESGTPGGTSESVPDTGRNLKSFAWDEYKIQFKAPSTLHRYKTESGRVFGVDDKRMAVDIEAVPMAEEDPEFFSDLKAAAHQIASDMGVKNIRDGAKIEGVEQGHYVIGEQQDPANPNPKLYPVLVVFILNPKTKIAFEATIDCYHGDLQQGIQVARSFSISI